MTRSLDCRDERTLLTDMWERLTMLLSAADWGDLYVHLSSNLHGTRETLGQALATMPYARQHRAIAEITRRIERYYKYERLPRV